MISKNIKTAEYGLFPHGKPCKIALPNGAVILDVILQGTGPMAYLYVAEPVGDNIKAVERTFYVFDHEEQVDAGLASRLVFVGLCHVPGRHLWDVWEEVGPTQALQAVMEKAQLGNWIPI